jgi:hypothetical protein
VSNGRAAAMAPTVQLMSCRDVAVTQVVLVLQDRAFCPIICQTRLGDSRGLLQWNST